MKNNLIRLTAGTRYVYFSSLYNESSPIYQKIGLSGQEALDSVISSVRAEMVVDPNSDKITTALGYLQKSAQYERAKEVQFFKNLKNQYPEIDKTFNINLENPTQDDYIKFIVDINTLLEGTDSFRKQLTTEIKRIKRNKEFDRTGNYKALTHNKQKGKLVEEEVANSLAEDLFPMKRGRNGGKKVFEDIFFNKANESDITKLIIEQFGASLFIFHNDTLKLDTQRTNALIKILTDQAYKLLIAHFENLASDPSIRTKQISEIILGEDFTTFYENIMSSPSLYDALMDVAQQYNLKPGYDSEVKVSETAIKNIKARLKANYIRIKNSVPTDKEFNQWLKDQGLTKENLAALYRSTTKVSALSYYTGEDLNLMSLVAQHVYASLGGGKNPTDDIYAGQLICTIDGEFDESALSTKLASIGREAYKNIKSTGGLDDFIYNTQLLRQARLQQEQELNKIIKNVDKSKIGLKDLLSHINIHTTIKGYKNAGRNSFKAESGFTGAAFGPNLIEQLNIIDEMAHNGIISLLDVEDLQFALVNAGEQMIGREYKSTLEDYFSMFVGFLMFNDAQLAYEDVSNWMQNNVISNVNDIHLYELNGATLPASFLLQNTYEALVGIQKDINSTATRGTKAILKTYNKGPITNNWDETLKVANKNTKLEMHFLAGFLDILNQINDAMPG